MGDFHWLPTLDMLGGTPSQVIVNILATLPVISMSFICHYNVHPIAHSLERFTQRRLKMVVHRSLLICTAVFTLVAGGGYVSRCSVPSCLQFLFSVRFGRPTAHWPRSIELSHIGRAARCSHVSVHRLPRSAGSGC